MTYDEFRDLIEDRLLSKDLYQLAELVFHCWECPLYRKNEGCDPEKSCRQLLREYFYGSESDYEKYITLVI